MNFFFDRNISIQIARMVNHYDRIHNVIGQDDDARFSDTTSDPELIRELASDRPKPVYLTADISQRKNPQERQALRESDMTVVFFASQFHNLKFRDQVLRVFYVWDILVKRCERARPATAFEISPRVTNQKVTRLCLTKDL